MNKVDQSSTDGRGKTKLVLIDQVLISGVNFATGLALARFLGPTGYGQYILANGVILFVAGLQMALIISPMMVKGPALPEGTAQDYYSAAIALQIFFCLLTAVTLIVGGYAATELFPAWQAHTLLWPLVAAAVAYMAQDYFRRYFFAKNRPKAAFVNDFASYGSKIGLLVTAGLAAVIDAPMALWLIGIASGAGLLMAIIRYRAQESFEPKGLADIRAVAREHWAFGKWLIATTLAYWLSSQLIIYMTAGMLSVAAAGAMGATLNIVAVANILFLALENLVPSRAAGIYVARGASGLDKYLRRVAMLGGAITFCIVAIGSIWQDFWLKLFYGSAYQEYAWLVTWWGVYYLLGFFQRPLSVGLRVYADTRGIFLANLGGAIVTALVSYPAIKGMGLSGAILSLCFVQAVVLMVMWTAYRKHRVRLQG